MDGDWEIVEGPKDEDWEVVEPAQTKPQAEPEVSWGERARNFARGVGQGATFNFGDEYTGAVGALIEKFKPANPDLGSRPDAAYTQTRDLEREANAHAQEQSKGEYFAGQVAGGVLTPGGGVVKGATKLATAGKTLASMAGAGALSGAGASEADSMEGVAKDAGTGAAIGAVAGPLLHGAAAGAGKVSGAVAKTAGRLKDKAEIQRLIAAGIDPKDLGTETVSGAAGRLRAQGVGGGLKSRATIAEEAEAAGAALKAKREAMIKAFEAEGIQPDPARIAAALEAEAKKQAGPIGQKMVEDTQGFMQPKPSIDPDKAPAVRALQQRAAHFKALPKQSFGALDEVRANYSNKARWGSDSPQAAIRQDVANAVNNELERAAGSQGKAFREVGRDQNVIIRAQEGLAKRAVQDAREPLLKGGFLESVGRAIGPSTRATANEVGAAVLDKTRTTAVSSAVSKALKSKPAARANSAIARAIVRVQGSDNPAKAHFLEQQTNPEYRKFVVDEE